MKPLILPCLLSALVVPAAISGRSLHRLAAKDDKPAWMERSSHGAIPVWTEKAGERPLWRPTAFESAVTPERGMEVYKADCVACHGVDRAGVNSTFPSLIGISRRYSDAQIAKQVRNGKGRMLAFPYMTDEEMSSLLLFLKTPAARKPAHPTS